MATAAFAVLAGAPFAPERSAPIAGRGNRTAAVGPGGRSLGGWEALSAPPLPLQRLPSLPSHTSAHPPWCSELVECGSATDCKEQGCAGYYHDAREACIVPGQCSACLSAVEGLARRTGCLRGTEGADRMSGAAKGLAARVQLACPAAQPARDLAAAAAEAQYTVLRDMQCGTKEGPSFKGKHSLVASDPRACEAECTEQGAICNGFLWAPTGGHGGVPAGGSCFFHSDVSQPTAFPGHHCYVRRGAHLSAPPLDSVRLSVLNATTGQALAPTSFGDIELVAGCWR